MVGLLSARQPGVVYLESEQVLQHFFVRNFSFDIHLPFFAFFTHFLVFFLSLVHVEASENDSAISIAISSILRTATMAGTPGLACSAP